MSKLVCFVHVCVSNVLEQCTRAMSSPAATGPPQVPACSSLTLANSPTYQCIDQSDYPRARLQGRRSNAEAFDLPLRTGMASVMIRKVEDDKYRLFAYDMVIRSELWPRS